MIIVYANDAPDYIQSKSTITLFADDSKLYTGLLTALVRAIFSKATLIAYRNGVWAMKFNISKCN